MGRCLHRCTGVSLVGPLVLAKLGRNRRLTMRRFATDEALKEIHRVLKPNAVFGMIWNIEDCKTIQPIQSNIC